MNYSVILTELSKTIQWGLSLAKISIKTWNYWNYYCRTWKNTPRSFARKKSINKVKAIKQALNSWDSDFGAQIDAWINQLNLYNDSINNRRYYSNQGITPEHGCFNRICYAAKYQILMSHLWYGLNLSSISKALFTSNQKLHYLQQYVTGEETRAI